MYMTCLVQCQACGKRCETPWLVPDLGRQESTSRRLEAGQAEGYSEGWGRAECRYSVGLKLQTLSRTPAH